MGLWIAQRIINQFVASISELGDFARFDRLFHGAIGLMSVAAAGKPAKFEIFMHFGKIPGQFILIHFPKAKNFQSGAVDNKSAAGKFEKLHRGGGVNTFIGVIGNVTDF